MGIYLKYSRRFLRINRYIMECKYVQDKLIALHHLELIDTLWNVNIAKFVMIVTPVAELIDTLWNVNYIGGDYYKTVNKN